MTNDCEGICQLIFGDQELKRGDRRGLDTLVVHALSYVGQELVNVKYFIRTLADMISFWTLGEVWSQGWNLKELTERHHQGWSVRLNLTQRGEPY